MWPAQDIFLEHVCPSLGLILSNLMYSAPFRDARAAVKRGTLGDLNSTPWAFMTGNSLGWLTYSFLINNLYIYFANIFGLILSVWLNLCATKLQHTEFRVGQVRDSLVQYLEEEKEEPSQHENDSGIRPMSQKTAGLEKIITQVTAQKIQAPRAHEEIVLAMVTIWIAIISIVWFADVSSSTRELIVGISANANLLFFFGAPLSTMMTVVKSRNSSSIHIRTMVMNSATGAFWAAYGIAIQDPFVYAFNAVGAGLGVIQVFLVMTFPRLPLEERLGEEEDDDSEEDLGDDRDDLEREGTSETGTSDCQSEKARM